MTVGVHLLYAGIGALMVIPEMLVGQATGAPETDEDPRVRLILVGLGIITVQGVAILRWAMLTFVIDHDQLLVDSGVLTRQRRVVPYARVQQVDVGQRLIQRFVGYGTVTISTAGEAGTSSVQLGLLHIGEARALRSFLLARREAALGAVLEARPVPGAAGIPGSPDPRPHEPVLHLPTGEVVLGALAGPINSVGLPAVAAGALVLLATTAAPDGAGWVDGARGALVAGLILVPLLLTFQTLATVLTFHGFVLSRRGEDLHVRSGLTQIRDLTVPRRRVQQVTVTSGPAWHLLGVVSVVVRSAAPVVRRHQDGEPGATTLTIPAVRRGDVDRVLEAMMGPGWSMPALDLRPPDARRRAMIRRTAAAAVAVVPISLLDAPRSILLVVLVGFGLWWGEVAHLRAGSADRGDLVAVASGVLHHRTSLVPVSRVQSAATSQSPLQRRAGLRSVRLDLAGGAAALGDVAADLGEQWRTELPRRAGRDVRRGTAAGRTHTAPQDASDEPTEVGSSQGG
jgi:putative membrane protein